MRAVWCRCCLSYALRSSSLPPAPAAGSWRPFCPVTPASWCAAASIVETNGSVSVCKRPGAETATLDDLNLKKPSDRLPHLPVLVQGEVDTALLQALGMEADLPDRLLKKENCPRQQALILLCNAAGDYRLIRKENAVSGSNTQQEE